ncbi:MAG: hypothetical protein ACFUZC_02350 [Chthoniobacteraceae bacterium]
MALIKNLTLGAIAGVLLPASLFAGTESKAVVETTTKSIIAGDLGVNFVSEYISRGVMQEKQGVIAQPYIDLFLTVYEGADTDAINKVTLNFSAWSSFHSKHTGASSNSNVSSWYEDDIIPGVSVTFLKNWTGTLSYAEYFSPSGAWDASRNITLNLAYNDTDLLGAFALHPHVAYLRELQGSAPYGTGYGVSVAGYNPVNGHGNYYEFGIAPALPAFGPVTVSFPLNVGFGSGDFYVDNKGFGYFSGGANAAVALPFIPTAYGAWVVNAGVTYYRLNGPNGDLAGGDQNRVAYQAGLGVNF